MIVVPGRPSFDALTWWVLSESGPPQVALRGVLPQPASRVLGLGSPAEIAGKAYLVATTGLDPNREYTLDAGAGAVTASACSRTLPREIARDGSFVLAWGSCYCAATDGGIDFPPKRHRSDGPEPIRLRFLVGDQLYMDLSEATGTPLVSKSSEPEPWSRYLDHWTNVKSSFQRFLAASPNLFLGDDHEFWNDYPHGDAWLAWSPSRLGVAPGPEMERAFEVFQAALNLDGNSITAAGPTLSPSDIANAKTFAIGVDPVSFFVLDVRTNRTRFDAEVPRFSTPADLGRAVAWLRGLRGPGILVISQPLIEKPASWFQRVTHLMGDANLPDYDADFSALWDAVLQGGADHGEQHDVLVLSGDIHWSRFYRAVEPVTGRQMYEAVSSPLALIPPIKLGPVPIGSPEPGGQDGKVLWHRGGRRANWVAHPPEFSRADPQTYSTLSLRRLEDPPGTRVEAEVVAWARRNGTGDFEPKVSSRLFELR